MTHFRRWFFLGVVLLGTQLATGCYLGFTNRPVLFPNVALSPAYARPGTGYGCGTSCYREFGSGSGCGRSLLNPVYPGSYFGAGAPAVSGPVYDAAPLGFDLPAYGGGYPAPGCTSCGGGAAGVSYGGVPFGGGQPIPIAGTPGGPPIATTPPAFPGGTVPGGPIHGVPFDSGMVPTVKPPVGSVPLQMPSEVKESKKLVAAGK